MNYKIIVGKYPKMGDNKMLFIANWTIPIYNYKLNVICLTKLAKSSKRAFIF
jgi:hypothetical protein